jgi:hypothetical protein
MKILCWNMAGGFGSSRAKQEAAWAWLNEQDVDVALLQEVVMLEPFLDSWGSAIFTGKWKNWGCAVLVRSGGYQRWEPTDSQPWIRQVRGAVTLARPVEGEGLWFGSIHSDASSFESINKKYPGTYADLPDAAGIVRCSTREMWEIEAIAHELAPVLATHRFVAGGDLNSSLLFDKKPGGQEEQLFKNLASLGFVDTRPRHSETEVQTYFKKGKKPYQLDHVYTDAGTEARVGQWNILSDVALDLGLSDHAPLLVEVDTAC